MLLERAGVAEPRLTAEVLLAHATGRERSYFFAHPERELREVEWIHFGRYLDERMQGKPTQYITGRQEFYGRDFRVTPDVLIPRPETELLVETVLKARPAGGLVVDVGTGSGAIGATLAREGPYRVVGVDVSLAALRVAAHNAPEVALMAGDLLSAVATASVDIVVSNPPYVSAGDAVGMQREVRDWEPHLALFAGERGLDVYERLIPEARRVLRPGGLLAMEIGFGQAEAVCRLLEGWCGVTVRDDLAGIPRVVCCVP